MVSFIQGSTNGRSAVGVHQINAPQPEALVSSFTEWPNRRQRILDLAASLMADSEHVEIAEVDGEFYWKICRDDLFDPLSRLAASIAPHLLDSRLRGDFSDEDQQRVESYRHFLQTRHVPDARFAGTAWFEEVKDLAQWPQALDTEIEDSLDLYTRWIQTQNLEEAGAAILAQLPEWVWFKFSNGYRIPIASEMQVLPGRTRGGNDAIEVRVYSRTVSGNQVEKLVAHHRHLLRQPNDSDPGSAVLIQIEFDRVNDPSVLRYAGPSVPAAPCILVTIGLPLPPAGVIAPAFDAALRNRPSWRLELPGSGSNEDKHLAIRTWSIALLMREGLSFSEAVRALEPVMGRLALSQEADRRARHRLIERVPDARPCVSRSNPRTCS